MLYDNLKYTKNLNLLLKTDLLKKLLLLEQNSYYILKNRFYFSEYIYLKIYIRIIEFLYHTYI